MNKREKVKYFSIILLWILVLTLAIIILTNTVANDIMSLPTLHPMPQDSVHIAHKAPIPVGKVIFVGVVCGGIIVIGVKSILELIRSLK